MNSTVEKYYLKAKEVPVLGEYDVVVVGGGAAGCAAALYAARHGANVLLVEKYGYLGGATVSQLVCPVLSTNGVDLIGVWNEYIRAIKKRNGLGKIWGYYVIMGSVDPEVVKYAWSDLLCEAGVNLLFHVTVSDAIVENDIIKGIVVESVAGTGAIYAKRVIDCSGNGCVADKAGVEWEQGDGVNKYAMALTKPFRLGNAIKPSDFPTEQHLKTIEDGYKEAIESGVYTSPMITTGRVVPYAKAWTRPLGNRPEMLVGGPSRILRVNPLDPFELTNAELEAFDTIWQVQDFYRKYVPGCENAYFLDTSSHIGIRSSRRICGIEKVRAEDVIEFKKYSDSIAKASWDIDIWPANSYTADAVPRESEEYKKRIDKMKAGDYYDIRYGCIVAKGIDNLFVAGRCISSDHIAQASLRIQQTCMATGQAAGTAAAISLKENVTPRELESKKVVEQLKIDRDAVALEFDFSSEHEKWKKGLGN